MITKIKHALTETYSGLSLSIYVIFFATIINRMGGFVSPFLSLFLSIRLEYSKIEIGKIMLYLGVMGLSGNLIGGFLTDHFGRKKVYIYSMTTAALFIICAGFLLDVHANWIPYILIVATFFGSVGSPTVQAMITDVTTRENRQKAFSLIYLGINFGVILGPVIAAVLFNRYMQWIFLGDGLTTLIAVTLIGVFVKETKLSKEEMKQASTSHLEKYDKQLAIISFLKRPVLVWYTFFGILQSFVYAQSTFGMSLYLTDIFGNSKGPEVYGQLMSFNAGVVLLFTVIITRLLLNKRPIHNIMIGVLLYAIGFGLQGYGTHYLWFILTVWIWTIGEIIVSTNSGVFVAAHTPINQRGRFNSLMGMLRSSGHITSSVICGAIIQFYGFRVLWNVIGITAFIAFFGYAFIAKLEKKEEAKMLKLDETAM